MKRKYLPDCLIAVFLSFCLGYGSIGCVLSGYGLRANPVALAVVCLTLSAFFALILISRHRSMLSLAVLLIVIFLAVFSKTFQRQAVSMVGVIWNIFAEAYSLNPLRLSAVIRFSSHLLPLLMLYSVICFACVWVLLYRQPVTLAAIPAITVLGSCFLTLDSMPQTGYILLWFFAFIMLLLTHPVRQQNAFQATRLTRLLALPVALCLLLVYVLVPPDGSTVPYVPEWNFTLLFSEDDTGHYGPQGNIVSLSSSLSLKELGPRKPRNTAVLDLTASFDGQLYLRSQDFDQYDRTAWQSSPDRQESDFAPPPLWTTINGSVHIRPKGTKDYLYIPCYTDETPTFIGGIAENDEKLEQYSFTSTAWQDNWVAQWRVGLRIPSREIDSRYLALPTQTLTASLEILAQISGFDTADLPKKAALISSYVRSCASYYRGTEAMPTDQADFAIWFLTEAETGYCVHYATAATVLLRAAGIPARYVEGYSVEAKAGKTVTVTDVDAHAWVEYYLDGAGWLIMDPTAADDDVPPIQQPTTPTTQPTTAPTTAPTEPTTRPTTAPTEPTTRPTTDPTVQSGGDESDGKNLAWVMNVAVVLMSVLAVAGIVTGQYLLRRRYKKRIMRRGDTNTQALARYREARRLAVMSHLALPEELTFLAEKASFSQHQLTRAEMAQFDAFLHSCTDVLRKQNLLRRFYLRIIRAAY